MSKKVLLLFCDAIEKRELILCEEAMKAALRKFRKSVVFIYLQIDLSPSCRHDMQKVFLEKAAVCDAVLWNFKREKEEECLSFLNNACTMLSKEFITAGKCICSPFAAAKFSESKDLLSQSSETHIEAVESTVKLCINRASSRKHSITICTDSYFEHDKALFRAFENSLGSARHYDIEHTEFDNIIYSCSQKIPVFDVMLTTAGKAHILSIHMNALNSFPYGHCIFHCRDIRVYSRLFFPNENIGSLAYSGLIHSCSSIIRNELAFESAGAWLKRAAAVVITGCRNFSQADFQRQLLLEINQPIRIRQVKKK